MKGFANVGWLAIKPEAQKYIRCSAQRKSTTGDVDSIFAVAGGVSFVSDS